MLQQYTIKELIHSALNSLEENETEDVELALHALLDRCTEDEEPVPFVLARLCAISEIGIDSRADDNPDGLWTHEFDFNADDEEAYL